MKVDDTMLGAGCDYAMVTRLQARRLLRWVAELPKPTRERLFDAVRGDVRAEWRAAR